MSLIKDDLINYVQTELNAGEDIAGDTELFSSGMLDSVSMVGLISYVEDKGGVLSGRVTELLRKGADPAARCDKCSDDRKGQTILGMEIIRGAKKSDGGAVWEGGKILDPENGKEYTLRMTPLEDGRKLQIRGYIGPFYRTQIWTRVE